ncbi:uncharacterized protein LOC134787561, partial [Penaeus indicus]|uniref:uncharacterized protein LOC134787561 n=1 Tax=Penaeus indicus TaxID=29960 RepID=UPI00300CC291
MVNLRTMRRWFTSITAVAFTLAVIFNWSLLVSSKKPSDMEQAFISDTAKQYTEERVEKAVEPGPALQAAQNIKNLDDAMAKIQELEKRLKEIEYRVPKKYPEVKFLTYKDRKRIL